MDADIAAVLSGEAQWCVVQADCQDVMRTLPDNSTDMVFTDPPYSTPTVNSFGRKVVKRLSDLSIQEFYFSAIRDQFQRVLCQSAPVLVFCDDAYYPILFGLFYHWQQTNLLVWDKGRIGMGYPFRRQHELIFYANQGSSELNQTEITHIPSVLRYPLTKENHAAEKPVALIEHLLKGLTVEGQVILDPFAGSGSVGVACIRTKRRFVGVELDTDYAAIARRRIQEETEKYPLLKMMEDA